MKKFVLTAVIILLLINVASGEQMYVLCRPDDYVNVRMFPSTNSESVGQLDCGDSVEVSDRTKKDKKGRIWIEVTGFEGNAWVCAMYLQDTPVEVAVCYGYVSANGRVAVRRSPGGKRVKWLYNGDEFKVYAMSEDWALTTIGYIKRELIDIEYYE